MSKRNPHAISLRPMWTLLAIGAGLLQVGYLLRVIDDNLADFSPVCSDAPACGEHWCQ